MLVYKLIKLILFLLFFAALTSGWIIKPAENKFSKLTDIMVQVFQSCNDFRTVVINGDADQSVIKSIRDLETSVIFQNSSMDLKLKLKNKVDLFVIAAQDSVLTKILQVFKQSPWWNIMTPFFVLSETESGCHSAKIVFKKLWEMDLLKCYFICFDSQQEVFIYTFNPYSNYAPAQWKSIEEVIEDSNYLAIFSRPYDKENICRGFNFDRTKRLDKATINIACCVPETKAHLLENATDKSKFYKFSNHESRIVSALKVAFNASIKFDYGSAVSDVTSKPSGFYSLLENKTSDFALCVKSHNHLFGLSASYTVVYSGFSIFSNSRGFRTPLEKIYNFYGPLMIAATIIISLITYFVIYKTNDPRNHGFAVFEIIRLWTATSIYTKINTLPLRIFFSVIFMYFLILQATFQGHLSKFLTKPELRDNAELLIDLHSNYYAKIYVTKVTKVFLEDENLKSKSHVTSISKCADGVLNDKSGACVTNYLGLLLQFEKRKLSKDVLKNYYLSKHSLRNSYLIFVTRRDWPLKKKLDYIIMVLENTGLLLKLNSNLTSSLESSLFHKKIDTEFKPIDLESLLFIYYFLTIGLTCASVCFIIEKCIAAKNNNLKIVKIKKKIIN